MSHAARAPHLASALSCVDLLAALYFCELRVDPARPDDPERDRFLFSKGHAATALYATLAHRGFIPLAELERFGAAGSPLAEQPIPCAVPGIEAATGSLGHGLPVGAGMALAARITRRHYRCFVLMGDGECNEGSVWEAVLFAPAQGLDHLAVLVDANGWQATDRSDRVMALEPLREKFEAFGWSAHEGDGHDVDAVASVLRRVPDGSGRPIAIVARTIKGRGVSFMEDDNNWHYRVPDAAQVDAAVAELNE
ncbi:MAG: transketolase [Phycisphaeraceae bacterium]|nr:transketolase [Phycisphaeraceae bacterium]